MSLSRYDQTLPQDACENGRLGPGFEHQTFEADREHIIDQASFHKKKYN